MSKGRDNIAESLGDILQMISSRKRDGLLSVERYAAGRFEEGEIYFQKGRPVLAHYETMPSQEAMAKLLTWRNVYYTFLVDVPVPSLPVPPQAGDAAPRPSTSGPLTQPPVPRNTTGPLPPPRLRNTTGSFPTPPWQTQESPTYPTQPGVPPRQMPPASPRERTTGYNQPRDIVSLPGLEGLIFYRLGEDQDVLSLPLTRVQRSVYLLVDGNRTVADIARTTRKSAPEVGHLLNELLQLGLVVL